LPWELCDPSSQGSPAVIANKLEEASKESRELGKHRDCDPETKIPFGIPILYSDSPQYHPPKFINGEKDRPWLVSVMLYVTAGNFLPDAYGLGTVFYDKTSIVLRTQCVNMRMVLFQGDIFHSIEESTVPQDITTWRISYVFKLIINPKKRGEDMRAKLAYLMQSMVSIQPLL